MGSGSLREIGVTDAVCIGIFAFGLTWRYRHDLERSLKISWSDLSAIIRDDAMTGCLRFAEFELDVGAYVFAAPGRASQVGEVADGDPDPPGATGGHARAAERNPGDALGHRLYVEHDSAINTAIRKIRRTLGDDAEKPRFVETVVGKGYRFIAPVGSDAESSGAIECQPRPIVGPMAARLSKLLASHEAIRSSSWKRAKRCSGETRPQASTLTIRRYRAAMRAWRSAPRELSLRISRAETVHSSTAAGSTNRQVSTMVRSSVLVRSR